MSTAAIVAGTVGAAGSIAAGAIGANAAGNAASTQANADLQAAQIQANTAQQGLDWQKAVYGNNLSLMAPYYLSGESSLANLDYLLGIMPPQGVQQPMSALSSAPNRNSSTLIDPATGLPRAQALNPGLGGPNDAIGSRGIMPNLSGNALGGNVNGVQIPTLNTNGIPQIPGQNISLSSLVNPSLGKAGSLLQPFNQQFVAPTSVTEQNDPGFQFRLQEGDKALQASAAASGSLLSGGTLKELERYNQDYASNEYGNVYSRAFNEYAQRYNQFQQQQTNTYNRLANLAGLGQTTAQQLGYMGQNAANNISSTLLGAGSQIGQDITGAGTARASGYVGGANAIGGAVQGGANALSGALTLAQLQSYLPGGYNNPL